MSEKHLTEPPWKAIVAKQGVKDFGLQKALAAYDKLDVAKVPGQVLDALKEIAELAAKLKKSNSGKEAVVDYLDEILKEAKRTIPKVEAKPESAAVLDSKPSAAAKPAEQEDTDEAEAAEFKKDLKKQMLSALAQVKSRVSGDPEQEREPKPQLKFMACLAGKTCSVIVSRKVGSATRGLLAELLAGPSGGKFITGECIFEKNVHTFVLDKVPGGLAKKLATALHFETGALFKVRVRSTDGLTILDSDTDVDPVFETRTATPPPATPPASTDELAKFNARLKALQPDLFKAIASKTPRGDEVKRRAAEAHALAGKKDFAQSHRVLDDVELLLKEDLITTAPPAALVEASATAPLPPEQNVGAQTKQVKLSTYLSGRRNLRIARENAAKELQRLQQVILAKASDEPFFKEVEAKSQKLFDYLAPIDDGVVDRLDEAGRCVDPERQDELNQRVREMIQQQLLSLRGHPLAGFVVKNPFGTFIIRQPLEVTLSALDKQLA